MRPANAALLASLALAFAVFAASITGGAGLVARVLAPFGVRSVSEITPAQAAELSRDPDVVWVRPAGLSAPALAGSHAWLELDLEGPLPPDALGKLSTVVVASRDPQGALRLAARLSRAGIADVRVLRADESVLAGAEPDRLQRSAAAGIEARFSASPARPTRRE